jgi:hypothetical protein
MSSGQILLLSALLAACGQSNPTSRADSTAQSQTDESLRASFLRMTSGDVWAKWPDSVQDNPPDNAQPCKRLREKARERAIFLLDRTPAIALDAHEYERLMGTPLPRTSRTFYLLRGFSTINSEARVRTAGDVAVVHSDALGGLSNLRRDPCIASLEAAPTHVYTSVAYDL